LDLPDVIELRREFIHENERREFIASSFLDDAWLHQLKIEDNILFIAAGVLYYFEEYQIKGFFKKIADLFPESEMVFDASSPLGIKMANKMVIKNGGMDETSFLKWGLKNAKEIRLWDHRIEILEEYPLFKNMRKAFKNKMGAWMSDTFKMQYMVHLKV
jgi:O-methyltransferase involved in polyketide biosynthesis